MRTIDLIIVSPKRGLDAEQRRRQVFAYLVQRGVQQRLDQRKDTSPLAGALATDSPLGPTPKEVV